MKIPIEYRRDGLRLVIPGEPPVKKNTATLMGVYYKAIDTMKANALKAFFNTIDTKLNQSFFFEKDGKIKLKVPYNYPLFIYSDKYNEWVKSAAIACYNMKTRCGIHEPIDEQVILECHFFMKTHRIVDQSALYEGVQDILAGSESQLKMDVGIYKVLEDDNTRFVAGHDGSRTHVDKNDPRTEVFIRPLYIDL